MFQSLGGGFSEGLQRYNHFMTKRELRLAVVIFALVYILGIVRPDVLATWEVPGLILLAGITGAVISRDIE